MPSVSLSHPITVIQRLCEDFIHLSQSHFALLDGDAEATVGNPTSPLHNQSLWYNESSNSGITPLAANNTGSVASGIYDMFASTGADNSAYFDLLTSDAIPLDLSGDFFVSDIS